MSAAPPQTAAANQARRKSTEDKLRAVADAIQQVQRRRLPVTYLPSHPAPGSPAPSSTIIPPPVT